MRLLAALMLGLLGGGRLYHALKVRFFWDTLYFDNIVDVGDDSDVGRGDHDNYFVIVIVSKSVDVGGKIQPALQGEPQLHGCLIVRHVRGDLSTRDEYDGEENNDTIANFSLKTQTNGELTRVEHI